ncbi:MAG: cation diffusion facilitator family transporter [Dehalococcoidia bacterium]|nr:cation diffusion facilitator family transporter [Dehalococcoidia bacterium]
MLATKENAAKLSIVAVSFLIAMKVVASIVTGSIAIRADAIHSVIDLAGAIVGFIGIKIADRPPDRQHPFGHGKAENIAGVVIASLIFIAAGTIAYQAITRLISGATLELVTVGIYVTAAAIAINLAISWYMMRVARATDSVALEATARDLTADVLSSVAVLVGLILVRLTGVALLDPIVALLVAILIFRTAFLTMKKSFGGLIDTRLPRPEERKIIACLSKHGGQLVGFHKIRTRKAGSQRYIDFHLVVSKDVSVEKAHQLCDELEQQIEARLSYASVTIHIEPCDGKCEQCSLTPDICQRV